MKITNIKNISKDKDLFDLIKPNHLVYPYNPDSMNCYHTIYSAVFKNLIHS